MDFEKLGTTILNLVGGKDNVENLAHCATRLRFTLKDESIAKTDELKKTKGVLGVVQSGGQYQIVIGNDVGHVYEPIIAACNLDSKTPNTPDADDKQESNKKKNIGSMFIATISGVFTPVLPAITAAGMLRAVLALLVAFHLVDSGSDSYRVVAFMADSAFYFLPFFLAASSAKRFHCSPYLALMLAGILIHPTFVSMVAASKEAGEAIRLFGIPIYNATYSSTVIPIILSVYVMSKIQPFAEKIAPKQVKYFLVPLITVGIAGILALTIIGPIGYVIGNWIASAVKFLEAHVGWLMPMILGGVWPLLVMTGTHYGLVPIGANNIMSLGYDAVVGPGGLSSNIAQGGAALAVAVRSKDSEKKSLAYTAGVTAVCGITEPALYGVNMPNKTPLIAAVVGGASAGLFAGLTGVRRFATGASGLFTLPIYMGGDDPMRTFAFACATAAIAFIVAFIVSFILYKENHTEATGK